MIYQIWFYMLVGLGVWWATMKILAAAVNQLIAKLEEGPRLAGRRAPPRTPPAPATSPRY